MKKRWISALLVLTISIGALAFLQALLVPKYQTGIIEGSMTAEYYADAAPHEVLFIGDDYGTGGNDESVYVSDIPFLCIDDYRTFPEKVQFLMD